MTDDPDYIVEINGGRIEGPTGDDASAQARDGGKTRNKRYISILFECCNVYQRIYRNRAGTAYEGHCPRCAKPLRVRIGPGGTDARFFRAT